MRYWHGYLSELRCKRFAYGPADVTATPLFLAPVKSRMVYLSGASLHRFSWKKAVKRINGCSGSGCSSRSSRSSSSSITELETKEYSYYFSR